MIGDARNAAAGASQCFIGPMAKQQRMAILTLACLGTAVSVMAGKPVAFMPAALALVVAGCLLTIVRRTHRITRELESK